MGEVWVITAGAYVGQELAAEFGRLPPSFLPVGTRRLYEYQLEAFRAAGGAAGAGGGVFMTLPESFVVPAFDVERLGALGVTLLMVPEDLSLGESVVFALNLVGAGEQGLRILHGDTLVDGAALSGPLDRIGTGISRDGYSWAVASVEAGRLVGLETSASDRPGGAVAVGSFAFSSCLLFVRCVTRARGDFIAGITGYGRERALGAAAVGEWHDFGHVQTYFRSRRVVATARAFNTLRIDGRTARKSSADRGKMAAEAGWLMSIPPGLRVHGARVVEAGEAGGQGYYVTEYEHLPTLSELFVHGALPEPAWGRILEACAAFLGDCAGHVAEGPAVDVLGGLVVEKTAARLDRFRRESGFAIDAGQRYGGRAAPSLAAIAAEVAGVLDLSPRRAVVMHGDFCFSNILWDSRVGRIRVIDPRGHVVPGVASIFGDARYDVAKFAHSVLGGYDHIVAGRYRLEEGGGGYVLSFDAGACPGWLRRAAEGFGVGGVRAGSREIRALVIGLFLSMLPLHAERPDRQRAFVANALRLHAELDGGGAG